MTQYECAYCEDSEHVSIMELKGVSEESLYMQCPNCGDIAEVKRHGDDRPSLFERIFGLSDEEIPKEE
ncbi:MAG: hypothetical protein LBU81_06335 [Methanosarcinales archaeon]|jgi:transcription elongation factor Elf1|nr:hypothetical protein [Methanosarcinales archaeon]